MKTKYGVAAFAVGVIGMIVMAMFESHFIWPFGILATFGFYHILKWAESDIPGP